MASDTELLERWRAGDREAGTNLFERYYQRVERFFVNKVPDAGTEIRDLVQETFMALVKNRDRVAPGKFRSYLFSVAYKQSQGYLRARYRRGGKLVAIDDASQISVHDVSPGPVSVLCKREEQRLLLEGLRRIPLADQTLLELFYWETLSTEEIAAVLGIPRGTVKSRLRTARGKLEEAITAIAASDEVLRSTLSDLDGWAERCRQLLDRDDDGSDGEEDP